MVIENPPKPYRAGDLEPFKFEVFLQCFAATQAWNRANEALSTPPAPGPQNFVVAGLVAVSEIQNFLVAAGILSDLFFPDKNGDQARGATLCRLYGVDETWRLANRRIRNSFVHVDQRLDEWLAKQIGKPVGPFAILPWKGAAPPKGTGQHLRIIDNSTAWRVLVRGDELELRPLLLEISEIGQKFPLRFPAADGPITLAIGPAMQDGRPVKPNDP